MYSGQGGEDSPSPEGYLHIQINAVLESKISQEMSLVVW